MNASDCYEQLSMMHPEVEEYKLHYAQALYKACLYQEAMKVACQIDNPEKQAEVAILTYRKVTKFSNTRKLCCYLPKFKQTGQTLRYFVKKCKWKIVNSEDPDQTAPLGVV